MVNPDESVHESWVGVKPKEFRKDRLQFNPYSFAQSTSEHDPRFYCNMHQQIFYHRLDTAKNNYVPADYYNLAQAREVWPEVMKVMDFHQIYRLVTIDTAFAPDLI